MMKVDRNLLLVMLASALVSMLLIAQELELGLITCAVAFPFEQLAWVMQWLGRLGTPGNAAAWMLLAAVTLVPLLPVMRHGFAKPHRGESIALCALAAAIPAAVWCMANPAFLANAQPLSSQELVPVLNAVLGGTVWSIAVVWLVLRLLRVLTGGGKKRIFDCLRVLLYALCLLFTASAGVDLVLTLIRGKEAAQLPADHVMTFLRAFAAVIPHLCSGAVVMGAIQVLDAMAVRKGAVSDEAEAAFYEAFDRDWPEEEKADPIDAKLKFLTRLCTKGLIVTTVATAGMNLVQLMLSPLLSDIQTRLELPVLSLAFNAGVLIIARLVTENRRLSEENDLFI